MGAVVPLLPPGSAAASPLAMAGRSFAESTAMCVRLSLESFEEGVAATGAPVTSRDPQAVLETPTVKAGVSRCASRSDFVELIGSGAGFDRVPPAPIGGATFFCEVRVSPEDESEARAQRRGERAGISGTRGGPACFRWGL